MKFLASISLASIVLFTSCAHRSPKETLTTPPAPAAPKVVFTITEGILHPESVLYSDKHKAIFVSNITSGNPFETKKVGYIGKYSAEGKVIKSPWIKNLKSPKGMVVVGDYLYVSDAGQLVKIDINKEKIVKTIKVPGSKFLNDMAADKEGNVYISDMMTDTIHVWSKKGLKVWMKTPDLRAPNGLYVDDQTDRLVLASWGNPLDPKTFETAHPGSLSTFSLEKNDGKVKEQDVVHGNLDGLTSDQSGNLWISDWMNGNVFKVSKDNSAEKAYNFGKGTADITFSKELNALLIPQMYENKIIAIQVE